MLSESHAREQARILEVLTRLFRLNPRYFAYQDLRRYLLRLTEPELELKKRIGDLRRRPRRTGKSL